MVPRPRTARKSLRLLGLLALVGGGCEPFDLEHFHQQLPQLLRQRVSASASVREASREVLGVPRGPEALAERRVLAQLYLVPDPGKRDLSAALRFVQIEGGLSPAGELLYRRLPRVIARHALDDAVPLDIDRVRRAITAQQQAAASMQQWQPPARPALDALERLRERQRPATAQALLELLLQPDGELPAIAAAFELGRERRRALCRTTARLELLLADALVRLARVLRRENLEPVLLARRWRAADAQPWSDAPATASVAAIWGLRTVFDPPPRRGRDPDPESDPEPYVRSLLLRDLGAVGPDAKSLGALVDRLPPALPEYRRLVAAYERYRRVVDRGGWPRVPRIAGLRPGREHSGVPLLRRRLALEGYLPATEEKDSDRRYDAALQAAVKAFQRAHQQPPSGRPDRAFFSALDVPASRRLRTIALNLERLRQSALGAAGSGIEVRINIADYHLEVYQGDRRLMRQRVVVGKGRERKCDEDTALEVLAFATPQQSARIAWLVLAPYWNVTATIKQTELDPERGKDPLFYEKHGYEVVRPGTPGEWVRQLPGPANALGLIKLIFPNPHETYLHDTPEKPLFAHPRRAFSHGCIRVADVKSLARLVLTRDGQWDEAAFAELHKEWRKLDFRPLREEWDPERYAEMVETAAELRREVHLRHPVPIHVGYYTARVDDAGQVHFLNDVYGLDRRRLLGAEAPEPEPCTPESELAQRYFGHLITQLEQLDARAPELAAVVAQAALAREGLDEQAKQQLRRTLKKFAELEAFAAQHVNLAQRVRDEHAALAERVARLRRQPWKSRLVAEAVRVKRLLDALQALHRNARRLAERIIAAGPPTSRPAIEPLPLPAGAEPTSQPDADAPPTGG